jgi:KDO2-lipid IV(A) lauroyltransferase
VTTSSKTRETPRIGAEDGIPEGPRSLPAPLRRDLEDPALGQDPIAERLARGLPSFITASLLHAAAAAVSLGSLGKRARSNLDLAFKGELDSNARRRVMKGSLHHAARVASEWARLSRLKRGGRSAARVWEWLESYVSMDESVRHLDGELERGRGVILATAHIGNWELLGARVTPHIIASGYDPIAIGLDRGGWLRKLRTAYGVESLPQNTAPRRLLEALSEGRPIALLADMEVRRLAGTFLPFFGVPALTMTAPAALARSSGCAILPMRCYLPRDSSRYRVSFDAPLSIDSKLPRKEATIDLTRRLNAVYEGWIRETPEQWAWYQPRWRTRPGTLDAIPLSARAERPDLPGAYDGEAEA